jgi:hypothetical protein
MFDVEEDIAGLVEAVRNRVAFFKSQEPPIPLSFDESDLVSLEWGNVTWGESEKATKPEDLLTIKAARQELIRRIREYEQDEEEERILLINAPAGLGKTHAVIEVAQELAQDGKRTGLFMDRHAMYEDITRFDNFDESEWYHWLPLHHPDPENPDNTMCQLHEAASAWTSRGYPLMRMCRMLCKPTGHMERCSYRAQAQRPERIIAGVHEHAVTGMAIKDYSLIIVDELPMRAFVKRRFIPRNKIILDGAGGTVHQLLTTMFYLSQAMASTPNHVLKAKKLMDVIGPILGDVFAEMETIGNWTPVVPNLTSEEDAYEADYWYLQDLLTLFAPEYEAWKAGWTDWLSRIVVTAHGITLLLRSFPWKKLPKKLVVLDATGDATTYKMLFGREVMEWSPDVARKGKIYQIANRLNGLTQLTTSERYVAGDEGEVPDDEHNEREPVKRVKRTPNDTAHELLKLLQELCADRGYEIPGVITHKALRPFFEEAGMKTTHFYGQRGTNSLEDCDVVFVVGTPSPPNLSIIQTFAALNQDIMNPFVALVNEDTGRIAPIRTAKEVAYRYTNKEGKSPRRMLSGFWWYPELQSIYQLYREAELKQALHRSRATIRAVDVWLLSTVAVDERLDGFFASADEALNAPEGISWQHWRTILRWLESGTDDLLTYETLSALTGVGEAWISRNKWLDRIYERVAGDWEIASLKINARGRGKRALMRA